MVRPFECIESATVNAACPRDRCMKYLVCSCIVVTILSVRSAVSQEPRIGGAARLAAWTEHQRMASTSRFKNLKWQAMGPKFGGGRIESIDTPRGDPKTIYAAAGSGGLWKSTNGGLTWEPIFAQESTFAIGDIAVAPTDPNTVWVGTGERDVGGRSYDGTGVFKSRDAGKSWTHMGLPESTRISQIVIDPEDKDIVYIGVMGEERRSGKASSVYKSIDGGKTFQRVLVKHGEAAIIDLVMDPNNNQRLFAAAWGRELPHKSGIYRSDNGGKDWTLLRGGLPEKKLGRIAIDVAASQPGVVYALVVDHSRPEFQNRRPGSALLFRSNDYGDTWNCTHQGVIPTHLGRSLCRVRVSFQNADEVYIGGITLIRSRDGGKTFIDGGDLIKPKDDKKTVLRLHPHQGIGLHDDVHDIWVDPETPGRVILGTDGGLYISWDRGDAWLHLNDLPIAEFYRIHLDDREPFHIWGGTQDNASFVGPSTARYQPGKPDLWKHAFIGSGAGADGFATFPDPHDATIVYYAREEGALYRAKRGELRSGRQIHPESSPGERLNWSWDTPFFASRHSDKTTLYCASQYVMRSDDGGNSWKKISPDLTIRGLGLGRLAQSLFGKKESRESLQALAESPLDAKRLAAGVFGRIHFTSDGGTSWIERSEGLPNKRMRDIVASTHHPERVFVALSGRWARDSTSYLYVTQDFGQTWNSIANNLPHEPVNAIAEDPETPEILFAGTDLGVYVSLDSGAHWESLCASLPSCAVVDLAVHGRDGAIVAATHGLGLYILDISNIRKAKASARR